MATTPKARSTRTSAGRRSPAKRPRLPALRGGHSHEDDDICACDAVFKKLTKADTTADAMLPAAKGGVEGAA